MESTYLLIIVRIKCQVAFMCGGIDSTERKEHVISLYVIHLSGWFITIRKAFIHIIGIT